MSQTQIPQKPRTTGYPGIGEAWRQVADAITRVLPNTAAYVASLIDYTRRKGL